MHVIEPIEPIERNGEAWYDDECRQAFNPALLRFSGYFLPLNLLAKFYKLYFGSRNVLAHSFLSNGQ